MRRKPMNPADEPLNGMNPAWSIDEKVEWALQFAGELTPTAREQLRADTRLQFEFPDEYVAYRDTWTRRGKKRALARKVIAHSKSLVAVHKVTRGLSPRDRKGLVVRHCPDPESNVVCL